MMNVLSSTPLLETSSQNLQNGDYDPAASQVVRLTQSKKKKKSKPPIESYEIYLGIGITSEGQPVYRWSPGLEDIALELLKGVAEKLTQMTQMPKFEDEQHLAEPKPKPFGRNDDSYKAAMWPTQLQYSPNMPFLGGPPPYSFQAAPKRRRVGSPSLQSQDMAMSEFGTNQNFNTARDSQFVNRLNGTAGFTGAVDRPRTDLSYRIDDEAKWYEWFSKAFMAIQQQACRLIAKEWIKAIQPKKQSTNPYNGNFPRDQKGDPDRTKPSYWPSDVQHKEPDHIHKHARTRLLVHLLMHTPQEEISSTPEGCGSRTYLTAMDLKDTLARKKDELKDKWHIIEEIIHVRSQIEAFNDGGFDGSTVISVTNYQETPRSAANGRKQRTKSKDDIKTEAVTASSSNEIDETYASSPTPPASPAESMATPDESDREDDVAILNASFTSTATQKSTRSTVPNLRPKPPEPSNGESHVGTNVVARRSMIVDAGQRYDDMDIKLQDQMQHPWTTVNIPSSQLHEIYASSAMLPSSQVQMAGNAYFGPNIYDMSHPMLMNGMGHHMGYHGGGLFPCDFAQDMNRGLYFTDMPGPHEMDSGQDFQLHDHFSSRVHGHDQQSHQ